MEGYIYRLGDCIVYLWVFVCVLPGAMTTMIKIRTPLIWRTILNGVANMRIAMAVTMTLIVVNTAVLLWITINSPRLSSSGSNLM